MSARIRDFSAAKLSLIALCILIFLASCAKKSDDSALRAAEIEASLENFIIASSISSDFSGNYAPEPLRTLLDRKFIADESGRALYAAEFYFPAVLALRDSSGFFDSCGGDVSWVDTCVIQAEEERIASSIAILEDAFEIPDFIAEDDFDGADLQENPGMIFDLLSNDVTARNGNLAFSEAGTEKFVLTERDGRKILVYASDSSVTRRFYDEELRLEREEHWLIQDADSAELIKSVEVEYAPDGALASRSVREGGSLEIAMYDDDGLVLEKKVYEFSGDDMRIASETRRLYNQQKKVASEVLLDYHYKDSDFSALDFTYEQRYDYEYNDGDVPPDFDYYEDGVLRMRNRYSPDKGSYTSQIFFDEHNSVRTYYESDVRVREVFFMDGVVIRERIYDQKK